MFVQALFEMEHLKHACFRHISAHFMRLKSVIFMHEISSDNIEEFAIPCMNHAFLAVLNLEICIASWEV